MRKINLVALSAILVGRAYASSASFNYMRDSANQNNGMTTNNQDNPSILLDEEYEENVDFSVKEYGNNIIEVRVLFNRLRDSDLIRNMFSNNNLLRDGPVDVDNLSPDQCHDRIALYESNDADSGRTRFEFLLIRGGNTRIENRNYHCLGAFFVCLADNRKNDLIEKIKEKGFYN